jgi:nitrite reductase/ring-hydroxylating ferredoxin subunit
MGGFTKVATTSELQPGMAKLVEVAGRKIALFNVDGQFYALDNSCTHRGGPLSEGEVDGESVTCPWHGASFDLRTGQALSPPAPKGVTSFKVQVEGSDIKVEIP